MPTSPTPSSRAWVCPGRRRSAAYSSPAWRSSFSRSRVSGLSHFSPGAYSLSDLSAAAFKLDVRQALNWKVGVGLSLLDIVFVFLFVDMFDNIGTLVAVTKKAGLIAPDGTIP